MISTPTANPTTDLDRKRVAAILDRWTHADGGPLDVVMIRPDAIDWVDQFGRRVTSTFYPRTATIEDDFWTQGTP